MLVAANTPRRKGLARKGGLRIVRACVLIACGFAGGVNATGQIVVDWAAQKLISYPQIVNSRINTTVVVKNVNDLLYDYEVNVIATPRAIDDAGNLLGAASKAFAIQNPCNDAKGALTAMINRIEAVFDCSSQTNKDGTPKSVSLSDTIAAWNAVQRDIAALSGEPGQQGSIQSVVIACNLDPSSNDPMLSAARATLAKVAGWKHAVDGLHQVTSPVTLNPDTDYQVVVTEKCKGKQTAQFAANFSPASNILTLSLGTLVSRLQQRSYSNAKDPTNTSNNILSVNGAGRYTPLGLALLNYRLPGKWLHTPSDEFGLSLSSGLALGFGSSEVKASSIGWFAGPSVHLYHRFFVAAGVHIGQFADYPPGLRPGLTVPTNYGDLNPVIRSTARFAFSVTYQTHAFVKGNTTPSTTSSKPAAK